MNEIRLTGAIVGEVELRTRDDGKETVSVLLRFSEAQGDVLLLAMGERVRHLTKFRQGETVRIFGRLTINPKNYRCGILVDQAHHLNQQRESAEDREADLWGAVRRHQRNAAVKDNRWAMRAGYVK